MDLNVRNQEKTDDVCMMLLCRSFSLVVCLQRARRSFIATAENSDPSGFKFFHTPHQYACAGSNLGLVTENTSSKGQSSATISHHHCHHVRVYLSACASFINILWYLVLGEQISLCLCLVGLSLGDADTALHQYIKSNRILDTKAFILNAQEKILQVAGSDFEAAMFETTNCCAGTQKCNRIRSRLKLSTLYGADLRYVVYLQILSLELVCRFSGLFYFLSNSAYFLGLYLETKFCSFSVNIYSCESSPGFFSGVC